MTRPPTARVTSGPKGRGIFMSSTYLISISPNFPDSISPGPFSLGVAKIGFFIGKLELETDSIKKRACKHSCPFQLILSNKHDLSYKNLLSFILSTIYMNYL